MAVTGIHHCWFVANTHKGIHPVEVKYDPAFCHKMIQALTTFFRDSMLPVLKAGHSHTVGIQIYEIKPASSANCTTPQLL